MKRSYYSKRNCILCGKEAKENDVSLFRFPTDDTRAKLWINSIKKFMPNIKELLSNELKWKLICSEHFEEDCFTSTQKNRIHRYAVPSKISSESMMEKQPIQKKLKMSIEAKENVRPLEENIYEGLSEPSEQMSMEIIISAEDSSSSFRNEQTVTIPMATKELIPKTRRIKNVRIQEQNDGDGEDEDVETADESILPDHSYHTLESSIKSEISTLSPPSPTQAESTKKQMTKDTNNTISNTNNELMMLPCEKLNSEKNNICTCGDEFDAIGKNVAAKLRELSSSSPLQYIIAEKLISDVLFHGQLEALTRDSFICVSAVKTVVNPDKFQITDNCVAYSILKRT